MKSWRQITPLEMLLAERLRRAEVAEDEIAEGDGLREKIRDAIAARYAVTRSRRHCVRGADVVRTVRAAVGPRGKGSYRVILNVIEEMGGRFVYPRNRFMVNGFRPLGMTDVEGVEYAKELRRDPWSRANPGYWRAWERRKGRWPKYREGSDGQ